MPTLRLWLVAWFVVAAGVSGAIALPAEAATEPMEEVVVTGSYIRGTPEDAALPVDVISREDLEDQGDPTINEMIRNLNVSSGALAETNQFDTCLLYTSDAADD